MKKVILLCVLMMLSLTANAETTASKTIEKIQVQGSANSSDGTTNYYFYNNTGWGAPSCPSHVYAFIKSDDGTGAKEMLNLAIEAKKAGATVKFLGDCVGSAYFRINYMYF